jgi:hypothetical protein
MIFKRNGRFIGGGNGVLYTNITDKNSKTVYFGMSTPSYDVQVAIL